MDAENGVTGMLENREVKFLGAAGGPVLVPGFSSDSISVATFQEQCVCLLQVYCHLTLRLFLPLIKITTCDRN